MKTKLLFIWAALGLLFAACEEEEKSYVDYSDGPIRVNVYAGMPATYGYADSTSSRVARPVKDVTVKIYLAKEDYVSAQNVFTEGLTDAEGKFSFEYDSIGSLWFAAHKDTLSNLRGVSKYGGSPEHNEIVIVEQSSKGYNNYNGVFATLTNIPTKLSLSVSHLGEPIEGATVQLYFTEQTYRDSLAAQEDFEHLRPTYGYPRAEASDPEGSFTYYAKEHFLQTTDKEGEVFFDNLEPRNYWFRITKDTLSNEGTTIRTLRALPQDADINNIMTVGIR